MKIGVLKEIKPQENRVPLTPNAAKDLIRNGHKVVIEFNAGQGSGFNDLAYKNVGCEIVSKQTLL